MHCVPPLRQVRRAEREPRVRRAAVRVRFVVPFDFERGPFVVYRLQCDAQPGAKNA